MDLCSIATTKKTIDAAKNTFNAARNTIDNAKEKLDDAKSKLSRYSFKRIKGAATALAIINAVFVAAALTMSIIALVTACKAAKAAKKSCLECSCDDDAYEYDFSLDDSDYSSVDTPDDEELSF